MKASFRKKRVVGIAAMLMVFVSVWYLVHAAEKEEKSFFSKSLHYTGEGMRYWYEESGGFMDITGIPYMKLDCRNCHVNSCDRCHARKEGDKCYYSLKMAKDSQICLSCHSREKVTFSLCEKNNTLDVHLANGMGCVDCHRGGDIHGDGRFHKTMREEGAVKVACRDCHEPDEGLQSHTVHKGKLDCAACHIANTTSCLNCHFERFIEEGTRKGNFFPPCQDWTLLVNYQGKVTSGNAQTLLYKGKKFVAYAPYFTHAVQAKARKCEDCHRNKAVKRIKRGRSVQMATFKGNQMVSWKGVVPLIPDLLEWDFADKQDGQWVPLKSQEKPVLQFACYAQPLTQEQLEKLARPQKQ